MSELEKTKYNAIDNLKRLCARCQQDIEHGCRVQNLIREIDSLNGVPVMVNDRLYHVVFS